MSAAVRTEVDVLCYNIGPTPPATVHRFYRAWRRKRGLPERCDNQACPYYASPLEWNGQTLPLILDHVNGNRKDNSPENLRLLCPNCDSQLPTRGGKNKGRIQNAKDDSYQIVDRDGHTDAKAFLRGQTITSSIGQLDPAGGDETPVEESRKNRNQEKG
jgi:HNH endonuclease